MSSGARTPTAASFSSWRALKNLQLTVNYSGEDDNNGREFRGLEVTAGRIVVLPALGKLGNRAGWPELQRESVLR